MQIAIHRGKWDKPFADIQHAFIRYYQYKLKSIHALRLYLEISAWAGQKREAFFSISALSRILNCSKSTVIRAIEELVNIGVILKETRTRENQSNAVNHYYLPELSVPEDEETSLDRFKHWKNGSEREKEVSNELRGEGKEEEACLIHETTPVSDVRPLKKEIDYKKDQDEEENDTLTPLQKTFEELAKEKKIGEVTIQNTLRQLKQIGRNLTFTESYLLIEKVFNRVLELYKRNKIFYFPSFFKTLIINEMERQAFVDLVHPDPIPYRFKQFNWLDPAVRSS